MQSTAIVFQQPKSLALTGLSLPEMGAADVKVEVEFSGISPQNQVVDASAGAEFLGEDGAGGGNRGEQAVAQA